MSDELHTRPYSGVWEDEEGWQFQLALRLGIHNAMATDGSAEGNLRLVRNLETMHD